MKRKFNKGDKVEILSGKFKGFKGTFIRYGDNQDWLSKGRVTVRINNEKEGVWEYDEDLRTSQLLKI